jgi:cyclopropane fatty-acyl-phospholipid synthase-like methyltransferase
MAFVGAQHEFHDTQFVRDWADRFVPSPERMQLFDTIIAGITKAAGASCHVVELGIGPAYLAERVLDTLPNVTYEGVDFSQPMLDIAAERLAPYASRVRFTQADLVGEQWGAKVSRPVGAIVSTWALHDLGGEVHTTKVYRDCYELLPAGGVFLNGDFVKPDDTSHEYEPGRFLVSRHLDILREVGFRDVQCLLYLEKEIEHPTAAQNYACLQAIV